MKKFIIALAFFAGVVTFMNINSSPAQYETEEKGREEAGVSVEVKNKLCPVTLEKITTGDKFTYTYEGKAYRFSSREAIEDFKKDPQGYLKEWEKKEKLYKINIIYD
jgi:YHS domain-containing protein